MCLSHTLTYLVTGSRDIGFMATTTPKNLNDLANVAFSDESAAVELMTYIRWPSGVACPRCGGADPYKLAPKAQPGRPARRGLYKCKACKQQFSVTTGTVFESSHLPLSKWLKAIHLMSA
ncbi:MAG: transposase, partial [Acidobacteria bacterium]|nr:transposase [Acidobacteriota bacterium]